MGVPLSLFLCLRAQEHWWAVRPMLIAEQTESLVDYSCHPLFTVDELTGVLFTFCYLYRSNLLLSLVAKPAYTMQTYVYH